jgi:hypothetical protein
MVKDGHYYHPSLACRQLIWGVVDRAAIILASGLGSQRFDSLLDKPNSSIAMVVWRANSDR